MDHLYRDYEQMDVSVCLNCLRFRHDIEAIEHYIFESGYCDPQYCPRCQAEACVPLPVGSI